MNIKDLCEQGWTIKEIAAGTGFHSAAISKYLKQGPPPGRREAPDSARVMNARCCEKVRSLIEAHPMLLGISVLGCLVAEGFEGGCSTVTRELRRIRGPRFVAADRVSVPIHTDPGEEAQFDFCNLDMWARRWGWDHPLRCFGMIMCWSRDRIWWFTTAEDRHHTFEGVVRFFEHVGGIPAACRTDRMGALGSAQGRRFVLHPPTIAFAAHHGTKITSCKAGDAKRKGKVERPFRQLQATFLPELEAQGIPAGLDEPDHRAVVWLDANVHAAESRVTGARPADRAVVELAFLSPLPADRFDTAYVETRRVHNIVPFISIDGARYSVPPQILGQRVEICRAVGSDRVEIRWAGRLVAAHTLVAGRHVEVWDPAHRHAAQTAAMADRPQRPVLRLVTSSPQPAAQLALGEGFDVEAVDLAQRYPPVIDADEETAP
ncbi:Mu transposase domain-containing protein [Candidatus Poriferisodalis sp.]|uniref:Mu transposase domain-containing protein n=1 Tax=Candidatus Poriferisodalis sp. TaxID=3101277 RepID=UPI003AF7CB52